MARKRNQGWSEFRDSTETHPNFRGPIGNGIAFVNCHYVVQVREYDDPRFGLVVHLWIRNNDGSTFHDWQEFQRIKNELVGPEWTAVEVYPPQSELVDDANLYHLFCFKNCGHLPFTLKGE